MPTYRAGAARAGWGGLRLAPPAARAPAWPLIPSCGPRVAVGWGSSLPCSPTRGLCAQHPWRLGARGHLRTGPGVCKVPPCHHPTAVPLSTSSLRTHGTAALRVRLSPSTSLGHRHVCLLADSCCRVQIALVSWSLRRVPSDGHTVLWAQLLPERKVGSWSVAQGFCGGSDSGCLWAEGGGLGAWLSLEAA